jgi:DHA1 family bicyclomycin/chloramphenicol resistance-like MFS transporter
MNVNPHSLALTLLLGMLIAMLTLAIDCTLPAMHAIQTAFSASAGEVQFVITAYMIGITAGQLVHGPLSDRYGRRPVLIGALVLYVAAAALSAVAPTLASLMGLRFLHGFAAVCGGVLARTIVRDLLANEQAARLLARVTLVFAFAPIVGPLIGGTLVTLGGWQAIFWMLAAVGLVVLAAVFWGLPETAPKERPGVNPVQIVRNFLYLLSQRGFIVPSALACASQMGVYAFVTNSALVVVPLLGYTPGQYAVLFSLVMLGHILGAQFGSRRVLRHGIARMLQIGAAASCIGGILLAMLSWLHIDHGIAIVLPMALYMLGNGLIMPSASAAALSPFPRIAGAASSLLAMLYLLGGAMLGVVISVLFDGSSRPLCTAIGLCGIVLYAAERLSSRRHLIRPLVV